MPLRHRGTKVQTAPWCFEYQGAVGAASGWGLELIITSHRPLHSDFCPSSLTVSPLPPRPAHLPPRPLPPSPGSTLVGAPNQFCCLELWFATSFVSVAACLSSLPLSDAGLSLAVKAYPATVTDLPGSELRVHRAVQKWCAPEPSCAAYAQTVTIHTRTGLENRRRAFGRDPRSIQGNFEILGVN